jgi:arginase
VQTTPAAPNWAEMLPRRILHVETNLGLRPGGVERLGAVLLELGLAERIGARVVDGLRAPAFVDRRDPLLGARNVPAVAALAIEQADRVGEILDEGGFPVVLGGDDSVLLGCLLALRQRGSAGLVLLDGHTDFWDLPDGSGELSDSDLWIATGHGPDVIADLEGRRPLVSPEACVVYGHRDRALQLRDGSRDVYREPMLVRNLGEIRAAGVEDAANHAAAFLGAAGVDRVWLHLDADCLDDAVMPAVDWRVQGGLTPGETVDLARPLVSSGLIAGMDVTIYNPGLDTEELAAGRVLLDVIASILA